MKIAKIILSSLVIACLNLTGNAYAKPFIDPDSGNKYVVESHMDPNLVTRGTPNLSGKTVVHYQWRTVHGRVPTTAVVGGREQSRILYICQASAMGGIHPGKLVAGRCNITYSGREFPRDNYRILTGRGLRWEWARDGMVLPKAIVGGHENGQPLYVCRAPYAQGVHPGKLVGDACNIGYDGKEIIRPVYQLLVED